MKRLMFLFSFLIAGLFISMSVMAAETADVVLPVGTGFDFNALFATFAGFSAGVLVLTGMAIKFIFKELSRTGRSILSWAIAAVIGAAGYFMQLGIFAGQDWLNVVGIVFSFAVGSNVVYNITWLREMLSGLKITPKKRT